MCKYVCKEGKPINTKKKTPSGDVPMIGTGGSCYYDIRANNNFVDFLLSFPKVWRVIKWSKKKMNNRPIRRNSELV